VYKGGGEKFVDGGKMSQYLDSLRVGDKMDISGPWGMHEYLGKGNFKSGTKTLQASKVGMMAGGTGITPMLQVSDKLRRSHGVCWHHRPLRSV